MARTYKKSAKEEPVTPIEAALAEKAAETKPETATADKATAESKPASKPAKPASKPAASVIAAPNKEVVGQIVYQPSSQILTREVGPNESFGVGDDMPVYYL